MAVRLKGDPFPVYRCPNSSRPSSSDQFTALTPFSFAYERWGNGLAPGKFLSRFDKSRSLRIDITGLDGLDESREDRLGEWGFPLANRRKADDPYGCSTRSHSAVDT